MSRLPRALPPDARRDGRLDTGRGRAVVEPCERCGTVRWPGDEEEAQAKLREGSVAPLK